jgi:hypothetical protein
VAACECTQRLFPRAEARLLGWQLYTEHVSLNCSWDEFGSKSYQCRSGQVFDVQCKGVLQSRSFVCEDQKVTSCAIWDGANWNEDVCYAAETSSGATMCVCPAQAAVGASHSSAQEVFMDFGTVTMSVFRDVMATLSVAATLNPYVIARNLVVFVAIGKVEAVQMVTRRLAC